MLNLDELYLFHPQTTVRYRSSRFVVLGIPVGLFAELPFRATLTAEVPLASLVSPPPVNDVRVWARWEDGALIQSHHVYPDRSLCACLAPNWANGQRGDWVRGIDPLHHLVAYCIVWIGKALYERVFDCWPGLQHYPAAASIRRNKPFEYCRCGQPRRYADCCLPGDQACPLHELVREEWQAKRHYLETLRRQDREEHPAYV